MKTKKYACLSCIILLACGPFQFAQAELVELDLLSLGCPTTLNDDQSGWTCNFDLAVQFSDIQHVYMDWKGNITAGLVQYTDATYEPIGDPHPIDAGLGAHIENPPAWRYTNIWCGESTYPDPEPFGELSEFVDGDLPFSELYDGQGLLGVGYTEYIILDAYYIDGGSIELTKLKLVVDGSIVPEPGMFVLLCLGAGFIKIRKGIHYLKPQNEGMRR
ncbi:MAG: PEP-CTERM sorting domain-containing protein [Sedimentisphaerales bacterium]|nr:PEP-CTERM sorting domain-containing protein [Sedimentisphaerales bacterium]